MDFDLPGRIKNTKLPFSGALLPVFEAVVNSIHAVDEAPHPENGLIRVHLERDLTQQSFPSDVVGVVLGPVRSVTIRDNGIGFTDVHYKSFSTADTRQKANIGGKGIGRFLWLKAFDHAEIESTFQASDGKLYLRKFSLRLTTAGVEDHSLVEVDKEAALGTSVRLCDYRPEFETEVPHSSETVGRKIVEHCLEHFVLGLAPAIYLHDSGSEEVHDLNKMFEAEVKVTTTVGKFKAGGRDFQIHNLRVSPGYQGTHRLHLCANNRAVVSENLAGKIPNLVGSLRGADNRPFMYAGYVSSAYLDECVNSERTDFVMPDDDSAIHGPGWSTLLKRSIEEAASFVSPFTTSVKNAKEVRITEYVRSKAPEYRAVVKHRKDLLDPIAPDLPDEKLDVELYKANQIYEAELRRESSTILSSLESGPADWETFVQKYATFLEEWNESGVAKLARHIVHRKATLDFLKASLKVNALGKYELESAIHRLIFPLKKTSDDVHPDQMNLWILDEKLTYHYYLASDVPFDKQDVKLPSKDREVMSFDKLVADAERRNAAHFEQLNLPRN